MDGEDDERGLRNDQGDLKDRCTRAKCEQDEMKAGHHRKQWQNAVGEDRHQLRIEGDHWEE